MLNPLLFHIELINTVFNAVTSEITVNLNAECKNVQNRDTHVMQ